MFEPPAHLKLTDKIINAYYVEAMVLVDEARAYFDNFCRSDREQLQPIDRVAFSCESLKVTTRLMHIVAWLIARRAEDARTGQLQPLGKAEASEAANLVKMPEDARQIINASCELYSRIARLDSEIEGARPSVSPARILQNQLEQAF